MTPLSQREWERRIEWLRATEGIDSSLGDPWRAFEARLPPLRLATCPPMSMRPDRRRVA